MERSFWQSKGVQYRAPADGPRRVKCQSIPSFHDLHDQPFWSASGYCELVLHEPATPSCTFKATASIVTPSSLRRGESTG